MTTEEEFDAWHSTLGLRWISAPELRAKSWKVPNTVPPNALWRRIVLTAHLVDRLRERLGRPVRIHSTYRSPDYNRKVVGMPNSLHLQFNAIDFSIEGVEPAECAEILRGWREDRVFRGGIGVYPTFVHVDTRGYNADW